MIDEQSGDTGISRLLRQRQKRRLDTRPRQIGHRAGGRQSQPQKGRLAAQPVPAAFEIACHPFYALIAQHNIEGAIALIIELQLKEIGPAGIATIEPDIFPGDGDDILHRVDIHPDRAAFLAFAVKSCVHIGHEWRDEGKGQRREIGRQPSYRAANSQHSVDTDEQLICRIGDAANLQTAFEHRPRVDAHRSLIEVRNPGFAISLSPAKAGHSGAVAGYLCHITPVTTQGSACRTGLSQRLNAAARMRRIFRQLPE